MDKNGINLNRDGGNSHSSNANQGIGSSQNNIKKKKTIKLEKDKTKPSSDIYGDGFNHNPYTGVNDYGNSDSGYRGDYGSYNHNNGDGKKKALIIAGVIIAIIILGILALKLFGGGSGDVEMGNFYFDADYELQGNSYVFDEDEVVLMTVSLNGNNIDSSKLSYSVDDSNIFSYSKDGYNCSLMGQNRGITSLNVYYDGKKIETISIGFMDLEEDIDVALDRIVSLEGAMVNGKECNITLGEKAEIEAVLSGTDVNYSLLSFEVSDNTSVISINPFNQVCKITPRQKGYAHIDVIYDGRNIDSILVKVEATEEDEYSFDSNAEVDLAISGFLSNYGDAVYYGDISYVSGYLVYDGPYYKNLSNYIAKWYPNVTSDVVSYNKKKMVKEGSRYRVGMEVEYEVHNSKGTSHIKEYTEYICVNDGGEWLIYDYENWKQLEKNNY